MDKLLLTWALLATGIQGGRLQIKEKSKLDGTESAATSTPVKALTALLVAFSLEKSTALVVGPHVPHAGLSHGQVGQGKSLNRMTKMIEGGSRVHVPWSVAGPSGPGTVVSISSSESDSSFPVAVRFDKTGETYNFAVDDLRDEPEGFLTQMTKNAEKMLLTQLAKNADKMEDEEAENAKNRKLEPGMDELDDRAFRAGPGPIG